MKKINIAFLVLSLLYACEEEPVSPKTPILNSELSPFIQKFVDEGAQRGVNLSTNELEALLVQEFSQQVGGDFCGYGWWRYPGQGNPRIEIRETEVCWRDRTEIEKENFVFHELGHALLERNHINEKLPNGTTPKSIMCGDGLCNNYSVFFADGPLRTYYFDELFNEQTSFPNSFIDKQFDRIIFQEDFEAYDDSWEVFSIRDEGTVKQYTVSGDSSTSANNTTQYSLVINNPEAITDSAEILVLKRFDLSDYAECANIVAKANIRTEGLTDGSFGMAISLRERDSQGELHRFFLDRKKQETFIGTNNTFEDFKSEIYCIPQNTDVVTISFRINSRTPATVYIDDVVLELWD